MKWRGEMKIGSGFKIGKYHVAHGLPCQDRAIAIQDGDLIILALSDGMGSYEHSDLGAIFAVSYIRENARKFYELMAFTESAKTAGKTVWGKGRKAAFAPGAIALLAEMELSLKKYAGNIGISPDMMHCTLSFAIIGPDKYMALAVGDSPLYALSGGKLAFVDGNNGESGSSTYSAFQISYAAPFIGIECGFTKNLSSVLITSDGCLGYEKEELDPKNVDALPEWYCEMIRSGAPVEKTLDELVARGYDDCSIAYYESQSAPIPD
jgi:hypothetical protein